MTAGQKFKLCVKWGFWEVKRQNGRGGSFVDVESGTGPCCTPLTRRGGRQTSGNGLDNYDNMNCNLQYKN
jgi:hypothetical protein